MRALLYARYSTTLQSSLSIDDQVRVCTEFSAKQGWTVDAVHCDAAISGAVRNRPGLNAMLEDLAPDTVVVAEAIDRLSRDQEDIAAIFKQVRYAGARIWTLSEGEISELHIGLRGTMAAMVRKDTADKVKRGLTGRALAGMNPGGMAYGYRKIPKFDERGEPVRGLREIDPDQAAVIVRVFEQFASGRSVRTIIAALNADGISSPTGGAWRLSTVHGDPKRLNGILRNELYRGRMIYNRTRRVTHPVSRKREIRLNPESEWLVVDAPQLRIVSDELWNAARAQLQRFSGGLKAPVRRPKKLLSGKAQCGVCGASWRVVSGTHRMGGRYGCAAHHDGRGCSNGRTITGDSFERRVIRGMAEQMLDPVYVEAWVREWQAARTERLAGTRKERGRLERRKADAEKRIARLVTAIADGLGEIEEVATALRAARTERDRCAAELAEVAAEKVVALHPGLAGNYRRRVASLLEALNRDDGHDAREAFRALIDSIVVTPKTGSTGTEIEVHGLLSSIVGLAGGTLPQCPASLVPLGRIGRSSTLLKIAC
jgi:site-specific DNA recombinase